MKINWNGYVTREMCKRGKRVRRRLCALCLTGFGEYKNEKKIKELGIRSGTSRVWCSSIVCMHRGELETEPSIHQAGFEREGLRYVGLGVGSVRRICQRFPRAIGAGEDGCDVRSGGEPRTDKPATASLHSLSSSPL